MIARWSGEQKGKRKKFGASNVYGFALMKKNSTRTDGAHNRDCAKTVGVHNPQRL